MVKEQYSGGTRITQGVCNTNSVPVLLIQKRAVYDGRNGQLYSNGTEMDSVFPIPPTGE
jgi:hypothetical protein